MQDRILRRIFLLAGIVLLVWVLYLLKPVVIPFIGAFFLAYLFSPLVEVLVKIKIPRWLAISIVFIGIGVTLTVALWYLVPLIWKQLVYARDSIPAGIHWINAELLPWISSTFHVQQ
ncbi:AI-2E family transporter, partial [Acinetobacter baumannii]